MRLFLLLQYLASALALTTADVAGTWRQVYSNPYVQATAEIDWACVEVDIAAPFPDPETLVLTKRAYLHGGPQTVTTPGFSATLEDGHKLVFPKAAAIVVHTLRGAPASIKVDRVFDLHRYNNDTLVVTGENDPTLLVWARGQGADPANVPSPEDVEAFVANLGFRPANPAYATVKSTYNATACASAALAVDNGDEDEDDDGPRDIPH